MTKGTSDAAPTPSGPTSCSGPSTTCAASSAGSAWTWPTTSAGPRTFPPGPAAERAAGVDQPLPQLHKRQDRPTTGTGPHSPGGGGARPAGRVPSRVRDETGPDPPGRGQKLGPV